jgi:hypothetical protein
MEKQEVELQFFDTYSRISDYQIKWLQNLGRMGQNRSPKLISHVDETKDTNVKDVKSSVCCSYSFKPVQPEQAFTGA